ncbi:MAG: radical SAM protein [Oscillospiraceae bacterium]|nr:radical SAM protein [Oscillospiraceae bacterium]
MKMWRSHQPILYVIPNGEKAVLYFPDSMKCRLVPGELAEAYLAASRSFSFEQVRDKYRLTDLQCSKIFNLIKECDEPLPDDKWDLNDFSTLILNVSNDCNMMCDYCFANHGLYQSDRSIMNVETAIVAIDRFAKRYNRIREIKFFGGEPLLNPLTIKSVCDYIMKLTDNGTLRNLPRLKVITNGTLCNDEILHLVQDYHLNIVFSLDGPPQIHDSARVFRGGAPTFEIIRNHFWKLKERTNGIQPSSVEVTYSNVHYKAGWSILDTVEYLRDTFNLRANQINVSLVNLRPGHPLALPSEAHCWSDFATDVVNRARDGKSFMGDLKLMGLIHRIKHRKKSTGPICSAGTSWSAISASGVVYPCLMFIDENEFCMGTVKEDFFRGERYREVSNQFLQFQWRNSPPCSQCLARGICNRCAGINRFLTGSVHGYNRNQCDEMRACITTLICGIAEGLF